MYKTIFDHMQDEQYNYTCEQILKAKARLPLDKTQIVSLNINRLYTHSEDLVLALLRAPVMNDVVLIQESKKHRLRIPGYTKLDTKNMFDSKNLHGVTTYVCNLVTKNQDKTYTTIIGNQLDPLDTSEVFLKLKNISNEERLIKSELSVVLLQFKKINICSENLNTSKFWYNSADGMPLMLYNLLANVYAPNPQKALKKNNNYNVEKSTFLFTELIPKILYCKNFANPVIYGDLNAPLEYVGNNTSPQNTTQQWQCSVRTTKNTKFLFNMLHNDEHLTQYNSEIKNSVLANETCIIDVVLARNAHASSKHHLINGGHVPPFHYHSAIIDSVTENKNIIENTNENINVANIYVKSNPNTEKEFISRNWPLLLNANGYWLDPKFYTFWRENELFSYTVNSGILRYSCRYCDYSPLKKFRHALVEVHGHFNRYHRKEYSDSVKSVGGLRADQINK
jgi:exonuclease III